MEKGIKVVQSTEADKQFAVYKPWKIVEDGLTYNFYDTQAEAEKVASELRAEMATISAVEDAVDELIHNLASKLELDRNDVRRRVIDYLTL